MGLGFSVPHLPPACDVTEQGLCRNPLTQPQELPGREQEAGGEADPWAGLVTMPLGSISGVLRRGGKPVSALGPSLRVVWWLTRVDVSLRATACEQHCLHLWVQLGWGIALTPAQCLWILRFLRGADGPGIPQTKPVHFHLF